MDGSKLSRGDITRDRIRNAAGALFAEKGFKATTVRDICNRADTNLASVNYHFRGKENLFAEVVRYGFQTAHEKYPPDHNFENTANAEERLRQFIWNMFIRRFDPELPQWFPRLISRNIQFAHPHKKEVLKGFKEKVRQVLAGIFNELITDKTDTEGLNRIGEAGVMGMVLFFLRKMPSHAPAVNNEAEFEEFVDRVYKFVLAGIRTLDE